MTVRIVLSGCSGGGKSTLLAAMAARGWTVVPEPGRRIVAAAAGPDDPVLPWNDMAVFARRALALAQADWEAAGPGAVLFDRGIVDAVTALGRCGAAGPADRALLESHPYAPVVFLVPPWPAIFCEDAGRRHGFAAAMGEHLALVAAYRGAGYRVVSVPRRPIAERARWWEERLDGMGVARGAR